MKISVCSKCHNEFEFVEGSAKDAPKLDKNGKKVTQKAAEHYAKNRFVCSNQKCKI